MPTKNPLAECRGCQDSEIRASLVLSEQCTACRKKERNRLWREANPGAAAATAKRWRGAGNKSARPADYVEKQRERANKKYAENPEVRERAKAAAKHRRTQRDPEELRKEHAAWLAANPGKTREYYLRGIARLSPEDRKEKGQQHREKYRFQRQAGMAAYNARRQGADGIISNDHLFNLHKWQDHCCFYCRESLSQKDTIEHVVPLARGGSNNPWNVVLVCGSCNSRKSSKIFMLEWVPETIVTAPRYHSVYGTAQLEKTLSELGIACTREDDHLLVEQRPVFILSSFWLGWAGIERIAGIKKKYSSAIIFFDKEFARRPDAIVNVIKAKAGICDRRGARKLLLEAPSVQDAQTFMGRWHAMGAIGGTEYIGLRDETEWWIVAAIRKEIDHLEIARMAIRESVAGGVSRIISHLRASMADKIPIVAFTDQRMGDGKSHFFAGFEDGGLTERSFFYATPEQTGFHPRRDFQKQALEQRAEYFDPDQTQVNLAKANGLMRVEGLPRLRFTLNP